ncbi:hypothetical protein CPB83DRAFT_862676 [Crepidotus variabilis]|uniref:Uncharacterized protein n=1 Tax=Crepidotus variabilis TaxID=179855 RepID=A0A9P6E6I8_9AGAR|nr:hypothetical protein CPB83DRAFT_862676 [Crepidotus variabilis]
MIIKLTGLALLRVLVGLAGLRLMVGLRVVDLEEDIAATLSVRVLVGMMTVTQNDKDIRFQTLLIHPTLAERYIFFLSYLAKRL